MRVCVCVCIGVCVCVCTRARPCVCVCASARAKVMWEEEQQAAFVAKEAKKNIVERQLGRLAPPEVCVFVLVFVHVSVFSQQKNALFPPPPLSPSPDGIPSV